MSFSYVTLFEQLFMNIPVQGNRHKKLTLNNASELRLLLILGHIDCRQSFKRPYAMNCAEVSRNELRRGFIVKNDKLKGHKKA